MDFEKYLEGQGVDVSKKKYLAEIKGNCDHRYIEPNNLYSLKKFVDFESLDFIYSKDLINETKFWRILIKEWVNFCKVGGHIIIEIKLNKILDFKELVKECEILIQDKGKIIKKEKGIVIIKKLKPILKKGDSMDKWTFGIITDGRREEWTEMEIDSIINLNIPYFEVIVCGDYKLKGKKNVRHIPFEPRMAWITKKKNLICQNAKYENIVVTHNRFVFDKNWYEGMKKYGNYFEILSCITKDMKGNRVDDWITFGMEKDRHFIGNLGLLNYKDWDKNGFIAGGFYILKKSVWKKCKWDESLIWGQAEDVKLSKDFYKNGIVARFNPFSSCKTLSKRGKWVVFEFNKNRFVKVSDRPLLRRIKNFIKLISQKYILK